MKWQSYLPQDQVFWYLTEQITPLTASLKTEVVIIGGGMAGLSAAQSFRALGAQVVLIEQNYCGSGASGKSSGFITPDAELSLHDLTKKFGAVEGRRLWCLIGSGVEHIRSNITTYNLACDYYPQDTLVVANTKRAFDADITREHEDRLRAGYQSTLYHHDTLKTVLATDGYAGGVAYDGTFGIQAYNYCQGMKRVLREQGVQIYEETPAHSVKAHVVETSRGTITADYIIICADRFAQGLPSLRYDVYQAQTVLMISEQLSDAQVSQIFPHKTYMIWDTDMIYQYYRLTPQNRLLLGGSTLWNTFSAHEKHNNTAVIKKLTHYFAQKFPHVPLNFEYAWPGMIGMSKDILPLAGFDATMPSVYYIAAAAGLPVAAALGVYSAQHVLKHDTTFAQHLSPYRRYPLSHTVQKLVGNRLTFMLSNFLTVSSI